MTSQRAWPPLHNLQEPGLGLVGRTIADSGPPFPQVAALAQTDTSTAAGLALGGRGIKADYIPRIKATPPVV